MTAEYRSVQTRMWREDDWFQTLDTDARLLFIYLFTNPSASVSGIYRLPLRTIEFESGIPQARVKELLAEFSKANKAHFENGVVWVVKMRENQLPGESISPKVKVRLDKDVASIPECPLKTRYLMHYAYPIDRVSIPTSTDTDTVTNTDTVTGTTNVPPDGVPAAPVPLAEQFHSLLGELKTTENKSAKLREIYVLCFGKDDVPDFGYLGKTARDVGGAGRLAELFWQYSAKPPTGDVLAYIKAAHAQKGNSSGKERTNGDNRKPSNGNSNGYVSEAESAYQLPEQYR